MQINCSMYEYMRGTRVAKGVDVISYCGRRVRDSAFFDQIDRVASYLHRVGVSERDNVAICLPNFPSALVALYAINKIGAIANVIHPLVPPRGLYKILAETKPKVAFIYDNFYPKYVDELNSIGLEVVLCGAQDHMDIISKLAMNAYMTLKLIKAKGGKTVNYRDIIKAEYVEKYDNIPLYNCENVGEKIAIYLHSGGTTGTPKTIMMSNRALNSCAQNVNSLIGEELHYGDSMLMVLPLFHIFGLGVCMHTTLSHNARVVLAPRFSPKNICRLIRSEKLNFMTGVPSMYEKLLKQKSFDSKSLRSLKYCYCGGDKLKSDTIKEFDRVMKKNGATCKLCEGYGLSEATICTVNAPTNSAQGSVGTPIGECKAGIFDMACNKMPVGERGEICIGGASVMSGYFEDESATNKVLFRDNWGVTWARTGDIGTMDESGHLYYVDRKKRMLKISGINVFPSEIESVVYDSVEEIDKCCAIDQMLDGKLVVKLLVTLKPNCMMQPSLISKITNEIAARLMKYSVPRVIEVRETLPLTHIGKVDYRKILINENQQVMEE